MEEKENTGTRASSEEGLKFPEGAAAPRASDEDRTLVFPESAAAWAAHHIPCQHDSQNMPPISSLLSVVNYYPVIFPDANYTFLDSQLLSLIQHLIQQVALQDGKIRLK